MCATHLRQGSGWKARGSSIVGASALGQSPAMVRRANPDGFREARGCVELLGKLAGQLKDSPTINVILMPEWRQLQAAVLAALEPHAEARLAVASALSELESHHAPGHA